jgi:hypothetical protein
MQAYSLPYELTISQIQGGAASSPYDGSLVLTHGVVTARYGSYFVVQDGGGPWNGIWARAAIPPAAGDSILVHGRVAENDSAVNAGNTLLVDAVALASSPGAVLPEPAMVATAGAMSESYEGVLVRFSAATCTNVNLGYGEWEVDDGSGVARVDDLAYHFIPTLGTSYEVSGPIGYSSGSFNIEPRDGNDVIWVADLSAPVIIHATTITDTTSS